LAELIVHLDSDQGDADELILFVVGQTAVGLSEQVKEAVATALRTELSPRHVPDGIVAALAVPRTLSGKKLEVPVKKILQGARASDVADAAALRRPDSLAFFESFGREKDNDRHGG
jgi:acetoacetyl-CoA synthetase